MKKSIFLTLLITVVVFSYCVGYSIGLKVKGPENVAGIHTSVGLGAPAKATDNQNTGSASAGSGGYGAPASAGSGGYGAPAPASGGYGQ